MNEFAESGVMVLGRTAIFLAVAAVVVRIALWLGRPASPSVHRAAWLLVLLQGWIWLRVPIAIPYYERVDGTAVEKAPAGQGIRVEPAAPYGERLPPAAAQVQERVPAAADGSVLSHVSERDPRSEERHSQETVAQANQPVSQTAPPQGGSFAMPVYLASVWLAGMAALAAAWIVSYVRFLRSLSAARPAEASWTRQWEALLAEHGVGRAIPIRVTTGVGPSLCLLPSGPQLLVPAELWKRLTSGQRLGILRHELAHYRRGDLWKSLAVRLLALPQWFNPLAWLAVRRFDDAAEWACDEAAKGKTRESAGEYARALLQLDVLAKPRLSYHAAASGRGLSARVRRLIGPGPKEDSVMKKVLVVGTALGLALLCLFRFDLVAKETADAAAPASSQSADKPGSPAASGEKPDAAHRAGAAGTPVESSRDIYEKRRDSAEELAKLLNEGRFAQAAERFDPDLKKGLPVVKLETLWKQVVASFGPFERCHVRYPERFGNAWLLQVVCSHWGKPDLILRLAFDRQHRVSGLWIDTEERQTPPGFPQGGYRFGAVIQEALAADLSLEARVLGLDGKPVEKSSVTFWMAIEDKADQQDDDWHDPATGKVWRSVGGAAAGSSLMEKRLAPGLYRVTARFGHWSLPPVGLSDPVRLDGKQKNTVVTVRLVDGPTLTLRIVNAATGGPAPWPGVGLIPKSGVLPPDRRFTLPYEGAMKIEHLPPGTYSISAGLSAYRPDELQYTLDGPTSVQIVAGKDQEITLRMRGAKLTEDEIAKRWPWSVVGRVTDALGQPIAGATVRAHCGMGTLFQSGITETGKDGRYVLRFSPGIHEMSDRKGETPVNLQAATISVDKPGFVEKNLHRGGNLTMANRVPPSDYPKWGNAGGPVLPGRPQTLDFVLVPALVMEGELLDAEGKPIERSLWIAGKELPPSCNVLHSGKTDAQGQFRFEGIPPGYAWWLAVAGDGRNEIRSSPLTFPQPGQYRVRLRLSRHSPSGLDLLAIESVKDAKGEEVRNRVVGDDPLARPPLPPELQSKGREILSKVAEANRYWLDRPPPEVRTYRYDFRLGGNRPKTYEVPEKGGVPGVVRRGISYSSVLDRLTAAPETVVFRQIDVQPDKIVLAYSLSRSVPVAAGNGVLGTWSGFFSRSILEGTTIVDPKTYTVREHHSGDYRETLSDYVEVRPGHYAPLRVRIASGSMHFDFRFRVFEPGLWLFASSPSGAKQGAGAPLAETSGVIVNGEAGRAMKPAR